MVGQHPELYGLPEVNLFGADNLGGLGRWLRIRPNLRHGLLRAVAELALGEQTPSSISAAEEWLDKQADLPTATLYHSLAEWSAPRRLVDKSPLYVIDNQALARTRQAFPDACYLHLMRHPISTCESVYKLRSEVKQRVDALDLDERFRQYVDRRANLLTRFDDPESLWLDPHLRILEFLEGIPESRQRRIRGEELIAAPIEHLTEITEWLGIRSDAEALAAMQHPEESPFARIGPDNARYGNDPNFLENPAFRPHTPKARRLTEPLNGKVLSAATRECAHYLGYD